ncbi:hypothetical protein ACFW04_014623 [Cataglyphis niger]
MDSPLSLIIADMLQDFEKKTISMLAVPLPFYIQYIDDVVLAALFSILNIVQKTFNSLHLRLQFTLEEGVNNRLNFFDFHKFSFSGRYLNFESQQPFHHKKGIIGLVDRAFHLSHPRYHEKTFKFIINTLLNNEYPLSLIFNNTNLIGPKLISWMTNRF